MMVVMMRIKGRAVMVIMGKERVNDTENMNDNCCDDMKRRVMMMSWICTGKDSEQE